MDNHHLFTKPKKSKSSDFRFTEVVRLESILTHVPLEGTNTDPFPKTATLIRFIVIANFWNFIGCHTCPAALAMSHRTREYLLKTTRK
ncbi:uncharacterized protein K444DRAFT_329346 [Hyaloscypha bicolor E]|uniref:Uncharacterized protein n=1 Tax=Hyaloscypha bicolor E TaxID=1095630 RepID=A0A2J6TJI1_9HELO|nr:uncharacterized protein K444DRAFT_329346 [Hyaloscypha bicolor E]PMD63166.1 hypothetical protein K444DRAFT_329346 [Hyaloscypha bicolor E]